MSTCRRAASTSRWPMGLAHPVPPNPMVPRVIVETRRPDRPSCRYSMAASLLSGASPSADPQVVEMGADDVVERLLRLETEGPRPVGAEHRGPALHHRGDRRVLAPLDEVARARAGHA